MRFVFVAVAVVAVALWVGARLVGAVGQIEAFATVPALGAEGAAAPPPTDEPRVSDELPPVSSDGPSAAGGVWSAPALPASGAARDTGFEELLIAEPDFQRAAAELMNDPDPEVRREGAEMLREFGVAP